MFEDIDDVIRYHMEGRSAEEIAQLCDMPIEEVTEIVESIEYVSYSSDIAADADQAVAIEKEIIRLHKIGYDNLTISEAVKVDPTTIRKVIENASCGGCNFPW